MRRLIPDENDHEYMSFFEDPQNYFLLALPNMLHSTKYMAVVDRLSTHSPNEEYIGERQKRDMWFGDAFYRFALEIQRIEKEIEKQNCDMSFFEDPQNYFLLALPNMLHSTKYMAVVDRLSTHSPNEEYIGERQKRDMWSGDAEMVEAFYGFASEIQRIEKEIEKRNCDMSFKNRCGAGVLPYELLAPSSKPGVTCRGIPNSVSI
ncbi:linoleate 13S-lipoxygenase 3-1, chloroplastic-like protein [Tanacetum coccineum]